MTSTASNRPIVVGVDGSTPALHAALWAADQAAQRHVPLRLVYADDFARACAGGLTPPQSYYDELQAAGEQLLADAAAAVRQAHPELDVVVDLESAGPVPALLGRTDDARLLVVGSRGIGGFRGMLAGSSAVALVAHGRCPVAVIRGATPDAVAPVTGPVVVGVDGSPTGEAAIAAAFEEASWRGAELVAVHSWAEFPTDRPETRRFDADRVSTEAGEHELLAERLAGWQEKFPDVTVRRVIGEGRPVECLLQNAVDAQLVVVGSRGHGGFAGMLLGSTSQALIYHATCPLLVVRPVAD
jgi:nucleotide-binding universal stress UspA family protein